MTNFISCIIISSYDTINSCLCSPDALRALSNNQHMLLIFIVGLRRSILLLTILASYQYFTACFLLQALLVEALGPNQHANIIDSCVLRNVDFLLNF